VQFRRQSTQEEGINLTPLIDVVFLLLIFFMVSTTFTKETHLEIDLPEASVEPVEVTSNAVIDLTVQANGNYVVNGKTLVNQQAITLQRALKVVANGNTNKPLTITADANTSHQSVVRAMDVAGQVGFSQLRITTRQPTEQQ
jgi:biopolymer transport protein ExbD